MCRSNALRKRKSQMSKLSDDPRASVSTRRTRNLAIANKSPWKTVVFGRSKATERIETESTDVVVISSFFENNEKNRSAPQRLELSENSKALLVEARRVLKRGGLLFVYGLPHSLPYFGRNLMQAAGGETKLE